MPCVDLFAVLTSIRPGNRTLPSTSNLSLTEIPSVRLTISDSPILPTSDLYRSSVPHSLPSLCKLSALLSSTVKFVIMYSLEVVIVEFAGSVC
jgi:hypothetical protein